MNILLDLFLTFAGIGLFTFGGVYGAIPLIRDGVLSYGWIEDEMLTYPGALSVDTTAVIMTIVLGTVYFGSA